MKKYIMGIDIGGTKCAVLLGRAQGDADDIIIDKLRFETRVGRGWRAVTEELQIPALVRDFACQSLSQPDSCQLPLHKGAKGAYRRRFSGFAVRSGSAAGAGARHVSEYRFT